MWSWWILDRVWNWQLFKNLSPFWVVWLRVLCCPVWVIAGAGDACDALCAQYQGSGVTTGKNADCAAISTLFVTICWPLWTPGREKKWGVMQEAVGREIEPIIWASGITNPGLLSTTCQKHGAMGIMLYFISGPRPRILIIRICYHCCSTIISYDSCVKLCYGHNDQNVWIILHYVIWTDFITPNMEVRGPGQEPFV